MLAEVSRITTTAVADPVRAVFLSGRTPVRHRGFKKASRRAVRARVRSRRSNQWRSRNNREWLARAVVSNWREEI
jgi:hypothetical protein